MDLNKLTLIGTLATDPVLGGPEDKPVTRFQLVTEERSLNPRTSPRPEATTHKIVAFGKLAQICTQYLRKGARVYLEGRLRALDSCSSEIVVDQLIMLGQRRRDPMTASTP